MSAVADPDTPPAKPSKMPIVIGMVLALLGGGGGFMAVQMGLIGGASTTHETEDHGGETVAHTQDKVAFIPLDPLVVSLVSDNGPRFLRFAAQIEVYPEFEDEVATIKPRIVDVLNGYLRAVTVEEIEAPASLIRLRAQMLRRLQVVAGPDRIRDLLIMEFVLN